jgi:hypothetical protein
MDTPTPESIVMLNTDSNDGRVEVLSPVSDTVLSPPQTGSALPDQPEQGHVVHRRGAVLDIDTVGIERNELLAPDVLSGNKESSPPAATSPQKRTIGKPRPRCAPRTREGEYVKGWSFE